MLKKFLTILICLLFLSSIADAWKAGYGYRKKITIQGANLDGNLTHFPVLIYTVDGDIDDHCDDDGDRSFDILFTQSDDTTLDVNWEDYSEAGGNATIIAWVSDAGWTIESDGSTEIYLYYGNAVAGDPGTDLGVWDANFVGVWHLRESGNGTDNEFKDSSGTNHGTGGGPAGSGVGAKTPNQVAAMIGNGQDFTKTNSDNINLGDIDVEDDDFTVEVWINGETFTSLDVIIGKDGGNPTGFLLRLSDTDKLNMRIGGGGAGFFDIISGGGALSTGSYFHCVARLDMDGTSDLYIDGSQNGTDNSGYNDSTGNNDMAMGGDVLGNQRYFNGIIDEVRVSDIFRGAAWTHFTYHNIAEGDNELTWGGEQSEPTDGFIPKVIIIR